MVNKAGIWDNRGLIARRIGANVRLTRAGGLWITRLIRFHSGLAANSCWVRVHSSEVLCNV